MPASQANLNEFYIPLPRHVHSSIHRQKASDVQTHRSVRSSVLAAGLSPSWVHSSLMKRMNQHILTNDWIILGMEQSLRCVQGNGPSRSPLWRTHVHANMPTGDVLFRKFKNLVRILDLVNAAMWLCQRLAAHLKHLIGYNLDERIHTN